MALNNGYFACVLLWALQSLSEIGHSVMKKNGQRKLRGRQKRMSLSGHQTLTAALKTLAPILSRASTLSTRVPRCQQVPLVTKFSTLSAPASKTFRIPWCIGILFVIAATEIDRENRRGHELGSRTVDAATERHRQRQRQRRAYIVSDGQTLRCSIRSIVCLAQQQLAHFLRHIHELWDATQFSLIAFVSEVFFMPYNSFWHRAQAYTCAEDQRVYTPLTRHCLTRHQLVRCSATVKETS